MSSNFAQAVEKAKYEMLAQITNLDFFFFFYSQV